MPRAGDVDSAPSLSSQRLNIDFLPANALSFALENHGLLYVALAHDLPFMIGVSSLLSSRKVQPGHIGPQWYDRRPGWNVRCSRCA